MKKTILFFSLILLMLLITNTLKAQGDSLKNQDLVYTKPQVFLSANLVKILFLASNGGYSINPEFKVRIKEKIFVGAEVGFVQYKDLGDGKNFTSYYSTGHYFRAGLDFGSSNQSLKVGRIVAFLGTYLFYTQLKDGGNVTFKEPFFGDYVDNFQRGIFSTYGAEINLHFWIPVSQRFFIISGIRGTYFKKIIMDGQPYDNLKIQYFPNIGANLGGGGGNGMGFGFDFKLMYQLF